MKSGVYVSAIAAAFCLYFLLQLLFGTHGIYTLRQTREYVDALEAHIEHLEAIQERLQDDVVALQVSRRRIEEEARRIGYYARSDIPVYRSTDRLLPDADNDFGRYLYSPAEVRGDSRALFRWIAFSFGLLCLVLFALIDGWRRDPSRANGTARAAGGQP